MTHSNIDRRRLLTAAAAIPAATLPAIAFAGTEPDPIFAAIDSYWRAYSFHLDCLKRADEIATRLWEEAKPVADVRMYARDEMDRKFPGMIKSRRSDLHSSFRREAVEAMPEHAEIKRLRHHGSNVQVAAMWAVADTIPATTAGCVALLWWARQCEAEGHGVLTFVRTIYEDDDDEFKEHLSEVVLASAEAYLRRAA